MNPYQPSLQEFLGNINQLKIRSLHFKSVLEQSVKRYDNDLNREIQTITSSALIISDWTGPTENGWKLNHHSGIFNSIRQETYANDAYYMLSFHCQYSFVQMFERVNTLFKEWIMTRSSKNVAILEYRKETNKVMYDRSTLPGGDKLFALVMKAAGEKAKKYSSKNHENIKFKEFWTVVSDARHAITHSQGRILKSTAFKTKYHEALFDRLFPESTEIDNCITIHMNYRNLDRVGTLLAEYAIQFFKSFSEQDNYEWDFFIKWASSR
ncbi:uncharacterized protein YdcH (DUF465 family) [Dyadobacter sp. BE34]|uniref:Uncharacterized protein YdcH (DUF465 family) n=1 Tax=Dyadobacter fermentans TaxID=94254 RepID=A0ABU1R8B9_9BACT|nr:MULTISPECIES: hypothetical protein [Dyadobacter]MDR6808840.1 uncharacterized protein YdcH (DUF465 family) [Dyadobacter fermentans]MDR7046583.1 uncharacterized protein YdcH (DUF465 family) [Dyadobacter sp. BE242]MDR7200896.1 uncharacterized protein YdcH (DUF465 family) [Dyadobacter sp. BE34]MDR7218857.1 uncharacterized protein YdcH (DUF465 family) [Dyadobacter sp. BE31]MDR7266786.1 uncharacterized protein YdcH (DUF465 family) [Dyadobacter sp. BE32]